MNAGLQPYDKAAILMEALPYIRKFYGKSFVIKYGGHAMVDPKLKEEFAKNIILLKYIGLNPIIVHGGGPQIGKVLEKMGIKSEFRGGMRVTDRKTMDVVEMVLVGQVNKEIVSLINQFGGKAVGLSGKDGKLIVAKRYSYSKVTNGDQPPEIIDLGLVGEVEYVNPKILTTLQEGGFIPVIAPVGVSEKGETLNINADLVAGKVASAIKADKLILLTDVDGVMDREGNLVTSLSISAAKKMIDTGEIAGGMIPKVKCCINSIQEGVAKAHIINGKMQHAILLEIFTKEGIGTQVILDE